MGFGQWLKDKRWANNMIRVRRFEKSLLFSERQVFYKALMPFTDDRKSKIAWPDGMMFIKIEDVLRAMQAVLNYRVERRRQMIGS